MAGKRKKYLQYKVPKPWGSGKKPAPVVEKLKEELSTDVLSF